MVEIKSYCYLYFQIGTECIDARKTSISQFLTCFNI